MIAPVPKKTSTNRQLRYAAFPSKNLKEYAATLRAFAEELDEAANLAELAGIHEIEIDGGTLDAATVPGEDSGARHGWHENEGGSVSLPRTETVATRRTLYRRRETTQPRNREAPRLV